MAKSKRNQSSPRPGKGGKSGKKTAALAKARLHLLSGEGIGEGLRALASLQLEAAIAGLEGNNVSPEAIHMARTSIKKVRAILQLASPVMPRPLRDDLQEHLRRASSRMAQLRDSEVQLQTLDLLLVESHRAPDQFASLRGGLADVAKQRRINDVRQIPRVIASLEHVRKGVPEWPLDALGGKDLRRRIRRTYRRGRTTLDLCTATRDPDAFHIWRKLVKQLWYQLRITSPYWPGKAEDLIAATGKIGNLAGTERDHTLLALTLAAGPKSQESKLLQERIGKILPGLRKEALVEGETFYSPKPKAFVAELDL